VTVRSRRSGGLGPVTALRQVPLAVMALVVLVPLYFLVVSSFKTSADFAASPLGLPRHPTLEAYHKALAGHRIGLLFLNSLVISVSSVAVATAFGALAAFALAKMRFRGREPLFRLMLPLMVVPPIALLVPQFKLMSALGLVGNRLSVIVLYVGIMLPFTIYLLRNFFAGVPDELLEAARLDGCGTLATLVRVILPLSGPALMTASVVNFVFAWNELLISLVFLQSESQRTLVVGLTLFRSRFSLDVPVLMAGLAIATIPVFLVYLFGQRFLVRGMLSGSSR
jgi:ABC-type glycerol-3-phosphate transport system permease component